VTQALADGNRITRKRTGQVARDSGGRVRRESLLAGLGPFAPGDDGPQLVFIHDPEAKLGYVLHVDEKLARKLPPPPAFDEASPGQAARLHAPGRGMRARIKDAREMKREDLGTQTIEGVAAQGTRTTHTIPAGEIGNERAIEVVHERWYSPELQAVVLSRHVDPRTGETTYRLTNIQRGEPDAALFRVPDDFKVEEGAHRFERRILKRKGAPR
jgi:hypothetical protein